MEQGKLSCTPQAALGRAGNSFPVSESIHSLVVLSEHPSENIRSLYSDLKEGNGFYPQPFLPHNCLVEIQRKGRVGGEDPARLHRFPTSEVSGRGKQTGKERVSAVSFLLRCPRLKTVALLRAPTEVVIAFVQQWAATPGTPALPPPPPESS